MKLLVKLRILGICIGIIASSTVFYFIALKTEHYRKLQYKEQISEYMRHAYVVQNASYYFKINKDSAIISPELPKLDRSAILMVVIVMTKAQNGHRRKLIRETWKKFEYATHSLVYFYMNKPSNSKHYQSLLDESISYNDIIVDNLEDNHPHHERAFASITSLRMLNWFQINISNLSQFLMQTNDEMFINVPNVESYLMSVTYEEILKGHIVGKLHEESESRKIETEDPYSPKFIPKDIWVDKGEIYPEYLESDFILYSKRIVPYILEVCGNIPLFPLDDVFITGMVVKWTLQMDLTDLPENSTQSCAHLFSYGFWWNFDIDKTLALKCPEKKHMKFVFSKYKETLDALERKYKG